MSRRHVDIPELVAQMRQGNRRALARLLSLVENNDPRVPQISKLLAEGALAQRDTVVLGLTGSPGVGKSTTTNMLTTTLRKRGKSVAVLAVDPSSPFSGGALLGDRIRMVGHSMDDGVYVRSMATRGHLGGLAQAAPAALGVLEAAGFDYILLETVGVGQSEVHIASLADTTLVLLAPGMGDSIQAAKAGVLEIGDVFVVNKADHSGADAAVRDLHYMISLGMSGEAGDWRPEVVKAVAEKGQGVDEILEACDKHRNWMKEHGELRQRRVARARESIETIALERVRVQLEAPQHGDGLEALAERVADGSLDAYTACDELLKSSPSD